VPPSALTSAQLHDVAASMNQEIRTISTTLVVRVFARSASGLTLRAIDSEFVRDRVLRFEVDMTVVSLGVKCGDLNQQRC
jgi:hypothetical protein